MTGAAFRQLMSLSLLYRASIHESGLHSENKYVRQHALRVKTHGLVNQARYLDGRPLLPN